MSRGRLTRGHRQCVCGRHIYGRARKCEKCQAKHPEPGRVGGYNYMRLAAGFR